MITEDSLFVPVDADGVCDAAGHQLSWPLPPARGTPGSWLREGDLPAGRSLTLWGLDGLLDVLGERIFLAEEEAPGSGRPAGPTSVGGSSDVRAVTTPAARLSLETSWNATKAALFAVACAEHVLGETSSPRLADGSSLKDVLVAARRSLEAAEDETERNLLGAFSRVATARRLRRSADEVAHLAFALTISDEAADADVMEDPSWEAIAATRDAVLAAVEAVRHAAFPHLLGKGSRLAEQDDQGAGGVPRGPISTPWGAFVPGAHGGMVAAHVAAREAAERAREAAADVPGAEPGEAAPATEAGPATEAAKADAAAKAAERAWQRHLLAETLS